MLAELDRPSAGGTLGMQQGQRRRQCAAGDEQGSVLFGGGMACSESTNAGGSSRC